MNLYLANHFYMIGTYALGIACLVASVIRRGPYRGIVGIRRGIFAAIGFGLVLGNAVCIAMRG